MQTMATLTRFGTPDAIQIQTTNALPSAPAGMVRVRTEASSVTFTDRLIRMGVYPDLKATPPFTLGYDCIGRVDQLGAGVTTWQVGQRVADLTVIGGNARYLIRPADSLIPVPESLDAAAAETMVLTYMSAYQMLHRSAQVQAGQRVLVHGAAGAVGNALLQLATLAQLDVVATGSQASRPLLMRHTPTVLDYRAQDYPQQLRQAAGDGFDVVFDGIGGATTRQSLGLLKPGGMLVFYGMVSALNGVHPEQARGWRSSTAILGSFAQAALLSTLHRRKLTFYSIAALRKQQPEWFRTDLIHLFSLLEQQQIVPLIHARYALPNVAAAHAALDAGVQGRVVLVA
ncbi:MAG: zinc-binding dehydrogenase [Chloroflexaceae bacterium]|nr:zinc-binding dehydrogenase [Chloroflexaceae bacterium]